MTVTKVDIAEVKAYVDATLEALHKELRDLNHQVFSVLLFRIPVEANAAIGTVRSGLTLSLLTKSTVLTIRSANFSIGKVSRSHVMPTVLIPRLKP